MGRTDTELIEACLAGSQAAWNELIERYGGLVHSIPSRYGLSGDDAADVTQTVLTRLVDKLDTLRDTTRLAPWLCRIAHRETWRTRQRGTRWAQLDAEGSIAAEPTDEELLAWERQHLVREGLRQLGGRCEELLTALFYGSGRANYDQVARTLGMKSGSVGPTRARCFEKLEGILRRNGLFPDPDADRTDEPPA